MTGGTRAGSLAVAATAAVPCRAAVAWGLPKVACLYIARLSLVKPLLDGVTLLIALTFHTGSGHKVSPAVCTGSHGGRSIVLPWSGGAEAFWAACGGCLHSDCRAPISSTLLCKPHPSQYVCTCLS